MERWQDSNIFAPGTADWFTKTFGAPTKVQLEAWPAIAAGGPVLISAPTGTGKTLSAFLVFIDQLQTLADQGALKEELYVIYVSPLKSLAGDIRENLRKPLAGMKAHSISVGIRTGDTLQRDRQRMVKHPPHILITTPESLFLMLTSRTGQSVLRTAKALIIDELHALIDTKRGAHLMLSAARLDRLCGRPLQRIGLSATIEPLNLAAEYLSPEPAVIAAPAMRKEIRIKVNGLTPTEGWKRDPVWVELAEKVYEQCQQSQSVIAFSEARRYAEKLAYYVNQLGGEGFARVHHGSVSKEQRAEVEESLRSGSLRLLCATSSMELGIDVGDIDQVLQIGCPRTISSTMQRLGRAGHNPGRVSVMEMYPRTSPETLYCGMTAQLAREGGVEHARPPRLCLDILAQHLVSMAATAAVEEEHAETAVAYTLDTVMAVLARAYNFREVTRQDVRDVLAMLAGDYEHKREIPVRPRVLYDRLHDRVMVDSYSRMLAVSAGGTIPDKGLYVAKTEEGVKIGELDEEFVYESQLGDRFMLGAFAWKIVRQDKDTVVVTQTYTDGARLPFWKGETKGRDLASGLAFGRIMGRLSEAEHQGMLMEELQKLGLNEGAAENTAGFLRRQLEATGVLPDDKTIVVEHFMDSTGTHQAMVHTTFGRRVNAPLGLLLQYAADQAAGFNVGCVEEEEGILLYSYGEEAIPERLLYAIDPEKVVETLTALLPVTPVFTMTFRYIAARALMMGMKYGGRQPLWLQRLRSVEMLESMLAEKGHPLIRETKRECLEEQWDIHGVLEILNGIRCGQMAVRELYTEIPSPMSLPMQWKLEAAEMYEYTPTTDGIRQAVYEELDQMEQLKPSRSALQMVQERKKLPENAAALHTLLMMEGDMTVPELQELQAVLAADSGAGADIADWLEELAEDGLAEYIEPGLWIAAEHREEYEEALMNRNKEAGTHIIRRMLYYRGAQSGLQIQQRYLPDEAGEVCMMQWLDALCSEQSIVLDEDVYYHGKLYDRARKATIRSLREQAVTRPPEHYAALMAERVRINASPREQLRQAMELLCGQSYPAAMWETVILPGRVRGYSEAMLDKLLAEGEYFWKMSPDGNLTFWRYEDIDWKEGDRPADDLTGPEMTGEEQVVCQELQRRGASFLNTLTRIPVESEVRDLLLALAGKGLVCADSFVPVRQWLGRDKVKKATPRQRVNVRVTALSAGRWDIVHPVRSVGLAELLESFFSENMILCRETFRRSLSMRRELMGENVPQWSQALELLRIQEFTGQVRRGYFIRGLSGAQFIRKQDYEGMIHALARPEEKIIWLNAADPAQLWGKVLEHQEGGAFLNVPGTAVALVTGEPAVVMERQGKVLRLLAENKLAETRQGEVDLDHIMADFVQTFRNKSVFAEKKRLLIKEYPIAAEAALRNAGFVKEITDYVLYR